MKPFFNKLKKELKLPQLIRYITVGFINTFFGFSVIIFCQNVLNINPYFSNSISYILGYFLAYNLHKKFTFKVKGNKKQAIKYLLVMVLSWILNIYVLKICLGFNVQKDLSQLISSITYVISSYFLNRFLTFKINK